MIESTRATWIRLVVGRLEEALNQTDRRNNSTSEVIDLNHNCPEHLILRSLLSMACQKEVTIDCYDFFKPFQIIEDCRKVLFLAAMRLSILCQTHNSIS